MSKPFRYLCQTVLAFVRAENFCLLSESFPTLALKLIQTLSQERYLESQLDLMTAPIMVRLAQMLHSPTQRFGLQQTDGWFSLDLGLHHEDFASLIGTTRVSVTQILGILRTFDMVQGSRGSYLVKLEALQDFLNISVHESCD